MFGGSNNYSLSDIAAVSRDDGIGGSGSWIWILLIVILFGGWGYGNGWANGGGAGRSANTETTSVYEGYVLNNDMSMLNKAITDQGVMMDRKFEGISNGICSLGYDQLAQINGINTNIMTVGNAIQTQLADCCCKTQTNIGDVKYAIGSASADISRGVERGFSDTNYNIATQANGISTAIANGFCQTNFTAQTNTRDIVDAQNAGTQAILARLDAMETSRLREQLEAERDAKYALQGRLDRAELRTAIVNDVRPCPQPAYITCNPFSTCNCNQGCGC